MKKINLSKRKGGHVMTYDCEDCGFLFCRVGAVKECPSCEKPHIRPVTEEETGRLEKLLKTRKTNFTNQGGTDLMNKRLLSMFLTLCIIVSMLPVSAMAEEIHTAIGGGGEIISFAPLTETKKAVSLGTSIEDLELPETLTATVRTAVPADENPTQDSGSPETATPTTAAEPEWEETTGDIPVRWVSEPEYAMNTEGVYVFTPLIESYTVRAELPELTIMVGEIPPVAAARGLVTPMSTTTYNIWVGDVQVTDDNKNDVLGDGKVTYNPGTSTLTLSGAAIDAHEGPEFSSGLSSYYGIYANTAHLNIVLVGSNTITGKDGGVIFSSGIYTTGALTLSGSGSLNVSGGTGYSSAGIYSEGSITIQSGEITATGAAAEGISVAILSMKEITILDGEVHATATSSSSYGMIAPEGYTITGGTVTATGRIGLYTDSTGNVPITISAGEVHANGPNQAGIIGAVAVTGGTVTISGARALDGSLTTSDYTGCTVTASTNQSGSGADVYNATLLTSYKFIRVESAILSIDNLEDLRSAITGAAGDLYLKLSGSYSGTGTITIPSTFSHNITIDLNGKTLDGGPNSAIAHEGGGTLTIIDSDVDGMVTSRAAIGTIRAENNSTVNISGGTVSATGDNSYAIYSTIESAQLNISGGTISAVNGTAISFPRTTIQTGTTAIIQGGTQVMAHTPTLVSGVQGAASKNYSGSPTTEYKAANLSTYKYLKFEPAAAVSYDVWVGSVRVTDANASDVLGDGKVSYTTAEGGMPQILTLNGVTIGAESQYSWESTSNLGVTCYAAVYAKESLSLVLTGNNSLTGVSQDTRDEESYGLYCGGALTVTGSGSLEATGAAMSQFNCSSYGLSVNGALSITDGATVTARGGNVGNSNSNSFGVFCIGAGGLIIDNATLTASAGKGYNSFGLRVKGDISITNGTVIATSDEPYYSSEAMSTFAGNIRISGGTVSAVGDHRAITVPTGKSITISSGAAVTAQGIRGTSGLAMSQAPNLDAYGGAYYITASKFYLGNDPTPYDSEKISTYRYLDIGQKTTAPVVSSVTVPPNGTYSAGSNLDFTVNFSEIVNVTGTPYISLMIGTAYRNAIYTSGSGTSALVFRYTVQVGDSDGDGITVGESLYTSGGTITDTAGNNATLTLNSVGITSDVLVNASGANITTLATLDSRSHNSITVYEAAASSNPGGQNIEYAISTSNSVAPTADWQSELTFSGLEPSTTYYVWARTAAKAGYNAGTAEASTAITTTAAPVNAQTLSFAQSTVTKTVGDPIFTNALTHSVGTGAVTYSSSNTSVATVHPTTGTVAIVGAGTATITANAAMVPGEYAPGSASFTLTVNNAPIKTVSVGSQSGTATAGSLTYTVTTANIADGKYAVSVANLPTGVTVGNGGNVTISGNSGTLALTVADTTAAGTTGTLALTLDGATSAAFSIIIGVPAPAITVTFNPNGGTVSEASRSIAPGTTVGALPTPTHSGSYSFDGWYTAASGGTQISASTTVNANVTYYAHWTYTGGGGSGNGGGSSSNDNSSPVIVTPPAPDKPNSPTQGEIKVPGTVDGKGNVTVNITDKTVTDAFDKAFAEAKKNGTEQSGITVVLRVDTGNKTGSNVTVNLPKAVQDTIIAKKIVSVIVVVDNPDIRVGMDLATVKEINKQAKSDVNITATRTDSGKLTAEAKKAIGSRPAFDLKVNYGNGKAVISFGAGSVSVTIPYTLGANEKAENICAVYVDDKGKIHWLTDSVYDSVEKVLHFRTNHFSTYGIGYKQDDIRFIDIAGHWAKEDIEFVVSRGLFSGTSATAFSPNTDMTRGMFVTALGRLANADVSGYAKSSFSDVKGDAYYMGYIEWANKNNIVNGVGNNKFAPDQSITREQMAVIMSSYAKIIGLTLQENNAENTFADSDKISAYAKDAVKQMQMSGIISGKNGNLFDPQGTATRAEVSAVLHRFVELVISGDIM